MAIGNDIGGNALAIPKSDEQRMNLGERLNRMSGVQTQKNLYAPKQEMGKDAFLKMFMEQLKYQDPMNPVKNENFNQQMAMFSQLEQQINMNKNIEKMVAGQNNQHVAALQMVGKTISADRGTLHHDGENFTKLSFNLPKAVSSMQIEIKDQAGEVAKTYSLDSRDAGAVDWKWDGTTDNGAPAPAGRYSYKIVGKGLDGDDVVVATKIDGKVNGVTSSKGVVYLLVDDQKVALNDVEVIKDTPVEEKRAEAPAAASGAPKADSAKQTEEAAVGSNAGPEKVAAAAKTESEVKPSTTILDDDELMGRLSEITPLLR